MHVGHNNPKYEYFMSGQKLETVESEKDIGVKIHRSLKPKHHCEEIVKKAKIVLQQISRSFHFRDRHIFLKLYKTYVRPHLEYCVQVWAPWTVAEKESIESVQKAAVGMISGLSGSTYEEKLTELHLDSLSKRRHIFDMVETFKIIRGHENVDANLWFQKIDQNARQTRLTAHPLNLVRRKVSRTDVRNNFFSQRVINPWNNLPDEVKDARKVQSFKDELHKHLEAQPTE